MLAESLDTDFAISTLSDRTYSAYYTSISLADPISVDMKP